MPWKSLKDLPPDITVALNGMSLPNKLQWLDMVNALLNDGAPEAEAIATSLAHFGTVRGVRIANEDEHIVEGYASSPRKDSYDTVFPQAVIESGMHAYTGILSYMHRREPVGTVIDYRYDENKLWVQAQINPAEEKLWNAIKMGAVQGFSIEFANGDGHYDQDSDTFIFSRADIVDISLVDRPSNKDSWITSVRSEDNPHKTPEEGETMSKTWQEQAIEANAQLAGVRADLDQRNEELTGIRAELKETAEERDRLKSRVEELETAEGKRAEEAWVEQLKTDNFEPAMVEKLRGERAYYADHPEAYAHLKAANKPPKNGARSEQVVSEDTDGVTAAVDKYRAAVKGANNG